MTSHIEIRRLGAEDLEGVNEIYNHYVANTHFTFDLEPISLDTRRIWYETFSDEGPYQAFGARLDGRFVGWVCSHPLRPRPAYRLSVETTIYLAAQAHGRHLGWRLYRHLFDALASEKLHRAFAGIAQPNVASCVLHERLGFRTVGEFEEVGFKFGRFINVRWLQKDLSAERTGTEDDVSQKPAR